jgi:hypothetical protein
MAMTRERKNTTCATHGKSYQTFVCAHLVGARGVSWYSAPPTEDDPWPDAWCETCHAAFEDEGEWNDGSTAAAALTARLLCHHCYGLHRSWNTPHSV